MAPVPTLHIHLDESGDWKFRPQGSKYFVLAAAWTYNPQPLAQNLTDLRFRLVREGANLDSFHASPDRQTTRNLVVQTMVARTNWWYAAVVLEKCKINPVLREPHRFYPKFAGSLLKFILRGCLRPDTSHVLVYADTIPMNTNAKREGVMKAMKTICASDLDSDVKHHVFSHRRESNKWLQVVDYCCWSVYKKWDARDPRTYNTLRPRLKSRELVLTDRGDQTRYY